jgi:hypothetical protein
MNRGKSQIQMKSRRERINRYSQDRDKSCGIISKKKRAQKKINISVKYPLYFQGIRQNSTIAGKPNPDEYSPFFEFHRNLEQKKRQQESFIVRKPV